MGRGDALPQPDAKHALLTALSHFGRGVAQAARGNAADAGRERAAYSEARKAIPPDTDWGYNKAKDILAVTDAVLDAWVARANRDEAGSIDAWRRAVAAEDALNYDEPPDWFYPTRESLGAALLRARRGLPSPSRSFATTSRATRRTADRVPVSVQPPLKAEGRVRRRPAVPRGVEARGRQSAARGLR